MKYFLDTEFLEGTQKKLFGKTKPTIDLISIGIVCEDGREYYAISKDFNFKEAWNRYDIKSMSGKAGIGENTHDKVYWIRENVLKSIYRELIEREIENLYGESLIDFSETKYKYKEFKRLIKKYGKSNKQIAEEIKHFVANRPINAKKEQWILDYDTKDVQFYGYYSYYDWVVFCWLFGKMIDLPKSFPMYCIDLKQWKDEFITRALKRATNDFQRNIILKMDELEGYPKQTNEHNALADAKWNYELYKFLNKL